MRADVYIYSLGLTKSRQSAQTLIDNGYVLIDGKAIAKSSQVIDVSVIHKVEITDKPRFVSRGGEKLDFALQTFNIDVANKKCIDIGASTGGFTDCLLQRAADSVFAIDSGHSQLDPSLIDDNRVTSIEKYNARFLKTEDFPHQFDVAVMDVSFISQTLLHRGIADILTENGVLVALIKPQFECGKSALNSKGVVKKREHHALAIHRVIESAMVNGFSCINITRSPIVGGTGNVEFLAFFRKEVTPVNNVTEAKIYAVTKI